MSDAEGLQASLTELLQQQTTEFEKTVAAANEQMTRNMDEFTSKMNSMLSAKQLEPEKPQMEAKIIDGGLWLNKDGTAALLQVLDSASSLLTELQKEQR